MKGKKSSIFWGILALLLLIIILSARLNRADSGISDTEDAKKIQAVLQKAYDLEAKAAHDFDTSQFSSVFVNDPRVPLAESTNEFVKTVMIQMGEPVREHYGFLDYKIAYFELWRAGALASEAIQQRAQQENRALTADENRAMLENMHRAAGAERKTALVFHFIKVNGNLATVVFDDGPRLNEMQLVKSNNNWYIAGWKILQVNV